MKQKREVPLLFQVTVEERLHVANGHRWHAQFCFYPLGYFRGTGYCPGRALAAAWRKLRRAVDPGTRWWTVLDAGLPRF